MKDLVPRARARTPDRWSGDSPFLSLQREMNRLFDDAFHSFGIAPFGATAGWPLVEVSETDKSVKVTAELPGIDEKDIELRVENNTLMVRGEKHTETQDKDKHYSERFFGRFERRLALPAEIDEDGVEATFKNGVLTVTLPKTDRAVEGTKRIPINRS